MLLHFFRALFFVIILAVLYVNISPVEIEREVFPILVLSGLVFAISTLLIDVFMPKKSLASLAGVFFGLLVGIFISWGLSPVLVMINSIYRLELTAAAIQALQWMMGICICYLVITIVMRTKDDVRFIIPYVEFAKQTKGNRPLVADTSAIIDGRLADLYKSKVFDAPLVVPRFVLNELQLIADSGDRLKRQRGRRGLDILKDMQTNPVVDVEIDDAIIPDSEDIKGVDQKLVVFVANCNGRLVTTDYNLSKVAQVRKVDVLNINDLANSLKAIILPGEMLTIKIVKAGEESEQGIGYLEDGTMVVVEGARDKIGKSLNIDITSSLQTSAGKMIFGKFVNFAQN